MYTRHSTDIENTPYYYLHAPEQSGTATLHQLPDDPLISLNGGMLLLIFAELLACMMSQ